MSARWSRVIPVLSSFAVFLVAGCAVAPDEPEVESDEGTIAQTQQALSTCYDWHNTCTGLPEGASCGNGGTCVAAGVIAGWCTCQEPPPPPPSTCPPGCFAWTGMQIGGPMVCLCP